MSNLIYLIDRPSVEKERQEKLIDEEPNLIDRTINNDSESKMSDLIDRNLKQPENRTLKRIDLKPTPELDVFFDNFEKEHYDRELELSSANLRTTHLKMKC
jgi:hypothetical protein